MVTEQPDARQQHLQLRHLKELQLVEHCLCEGKGGLAFENVEWIHLFLARALDLLRLRKRGEANALDLRLKELQWHFPDLPPSFDGYTILHLSDLHIDGLQPLHERIYELLGRKKADLVVITGDFRFSTSGPQHLVLEFLEKIADRLCGVDGALAILGNHDTAQIVEPLERLGLRVLLNENHIIHRNGERLILAGVDDLHFYAMGDLERCHRQSAPTGTSDFKILLVHSPEAIAEAEALGYSFYLCGHTHGGQICLPGGVPILVNARCRRKFAAGSWRYGKMAGYTHLGTGSSCLPVRFFCRPEIVLHKLQRNNQLE